MLICGYVLLFSLFILYLLHLYLDCDVDCLLSHHSFSGLLTHSVDKDKKGKDKEKGQDKGGSDKEKGSGKSQDKGINKSVDNHPSSSSYAPLPLSSPLLPSPTKDDVQEHPLQQSFDLTNNNDNDDDGEEDKGQILAQLNIKAQGWIEVPYPFIPYLTI